MKGARTAHSKQIVPGSEVTVVEKMKRCPKCGRIMMDERVKTGRNWQVIWHCLCGFKEVENGR